MDETDEDRAGVLWRHLDPQLWVAIGPEGHLGTIEQHRRYVVVDTRGDVRGRCRTLDHAKAVLVAVSDGTRSRLQRGAA